MILLVYGNLKKQRRRIEMKIETAESLAGVHTHTHTSLLENKRKNNYIDKRDIDLVFLC